MAVQGPVVGREREAAALRAAWAAAGTGEPRAVLVAGDAGVGKTRLLAALAEAARAEGATVLVGHCLSVGGVGLPYLAFSEALAPLVDAGAPALEGATGETGQLQLFDTVARSLSDAARRQPVLLLLEDLHWADQSTRDLLAFLLARVRDQRLLVVGSYRAEDLHRRHPLRGLVADLVRLPYVERLDLAPFDLDDMAAFLAALHGSPVPDGVVRRVHERSGGNAYFAQELFESGGGAGSGLPQALADVLLARVESLPAPVQHVARVASVGGRRVDDVLLRRVAALEDDALEAALREAVVSSVLVPDGRDGFGFRHALLQEALYGDLLPGERVRLHAAYAQAVEDGLGPAAALAHHRSESHDVPGALVASLAAADEAERLRAPAEAGQHLERALRLWSAVPDAEELTGTDQVRLTVRAAAVASQGGRVHRAVALSRSARELAPDDDAALAALTAVRLAEHLLAAEDDEGARAAALDAVRLAPGSASAAWGEALAARSLLHEPGRQDEARGHAERARSSAVRLELPAVEADALVSLAFFDVSRGCDAVGLLARAVERAREAGHLPAELRASFNVVVDHYERGDLDEALRVVDAAVERCTATGLTWSPYGLELRHMQVVTRYTMGDFAGSADAARLVGDQPPDAVAARLTAASLFGAVAAGDPGAGSTAQRLEGAWHHDPMIALAAGGSAADLLTWQGRPQAALDAVDRVTRHLGEIWRPWFLAGIWLSALGLAAAADLAETSRLTRDAEGEARALAAGERLIQRAQRTEREGRPRSGTLGPEGRAWLRRAEAEAARLRGEADVAAWEAAREAFGYGHVYEQARSTWRLAEALLAHDRRAEAGAALASARETAVRLGARPLLGALDVLARRARLGDATGASAGPLTPREREVLALLAEGRTNRQIGQRLYISEKTASVHVSNILAKLEVSGRTEAVSRAYREGLLPSSGA